MGTLALICGATAFMAGVFICVCLGFSIFPIGLVAIGLVTFALSLIFRGKATDHKREANYGSLAGLLGVCFTVAFCVCYFA